MTTPITPEEQEKLARAVTDAYRICVAAHPLIDKTMREFLKTMQEQKDPKVSLPTAMTALQVSLLESAAKAYLDLLASSGIEMSPAEAKSDFAKSARIAFNHYLDAMKREQR